MTKKLRIRFITFSMLILFIMQGVIILFSAFNSYNNMITKADRTINIIRNTYPEVANVDARYFVVTIPHNGNKKNIDLSHISSVNQKKAQEYIKSALDKESAYGFVDTFRYQIFKEDPGLTIIFLSRNYSIDSLNNSIHSLILFSLIGMGIMFFVLLVVSFWVTRPISLAYQKQQQFITSASHQLGTPLSVIKADTDILLYDDPKNKWLQDIDKQTLRMTDMTQKLITLAKLSEQNVQRKHIAFSISDLAEDITNSYCSISECKKITFTSNITENISYLGDENQIRQLLTILLDNAFKYCPSEGIIKFSLIKSFNKILLSVTNTTEDISKESLTNIFDRFYRAENAASSQKQGHGLGLSIAMSIVENHHGKILAKLPNANTLAIHITLH